MEKRTVHVVGNFNEYATMFMANGWVVVDNVEDADLVQFCGGADVNPSMYGEQRHFSTRTNDDRDVYEERIFEMAFKESKAIAGICRGAQFVHVMSGGKLFQDVNNHAIYGTHFGTIEADRLKHISPHGFHMSSTHHQMMMDGVGEVIVSSKLANRKETAQGPIVITPQELDLEAVYHEPTSALCYQPHPEFYSKTMPCQEVYFALIEELLFNDDDT